MTAFVTLGQTVKCCINYNGAIWQFLARVVREKYYDRHDCENRTDVRIITAELIHGNLVKSPVGEEFRLSDCNCQVQ